MNNYITLTKFRSCSSRPRRDTKCAVGLNLYPCHKKVIKAGERVEIRTGLKVDLPTGTYGRITNSQTSLSYRAGLLVIPNVINQHYEWEIKVSMINLSNLSYEIQKTDAIAALICEKAIIPQMLYVENIQTSETCRKRDGTMISTSTPLQTEKVPTLIHNEKHVTGSVSDSSILKESEASDEPSVKKTNAQMMSERSEMNADRDRQVSFFYNSW